MKKRVLILPDTPNWAYDIIAKNVQKYADKEKYDIHIRYIRDILLGKCSVNFEEWDVVHPMFWHDFCEMRGRGYYPGCDLSKVVLGIHGTNSWVKRKIPFDRVLSMISEVRSIGLISMEMYDMIPEKLEIHKNKWIPMPEKVYLPSGYDPELFNFTTPPPFTNPQDPFRFMWVGNPGKNHGCIKGYAKYIEPTIRAIQKRHPNVELIVATKEDQIPPEDMGKFYSRGHVLICTSLREGSPLPVIEAMASGRPVISTSVGIVPEVLDSSCGKIIERDKVSLKEAMLEILDEDICVLGQNAIKNIEDRSWPEAVKNYERFFDLVEVE